MADATIEWSVEFSRIQDIVQGLNEAGNVPKSLRNDLESRLALAWGEILLEIVEMVISAS